MLTSDDFDLINGFVGDESAEADEEEGGEKKEYDLSDEGYKKALWTHYSLPLNAYPTQERLQEIYDMIHSEDKETQDEGVTYLLGVMSSYIISVIKKRYYTYIPLHLADMMQQGYIAVIKDADGFDPERGTPSTFFATRIDHEIQNYINGLHSSTPHYTSALKKIRECIARKKKRGVSFTIQDICIETGLSMATVAKCVRIKDTKKISFESTEIAETMQSPFRTPEEEMMAREDVEYARRLIQESNLSEKEKICLCLRYGIGQDEDRNMSYAEIKDKMAEYGIPMTLNEIQRTLADAGEKIRIENGKIRRAAACHRIRTDVDRRISGDMISRFAMQSDQEAVAEYFRTGLLSI